MNITYSLQQVKDCKFLFGRGWQRWMREIPSDTKNQEILSGYSLLLCPLLELQNVPDGMVFGSVYPTPWKTIDKKLYVKGKDFNWVEGNGIMMLYPDQEDADWADDRDWWELEIAKRLEPKDYNPAASLWPAVKAKLITESKSFLNIGLFIHNVTQEIYCPSDVQYRSINEPFEISKYEV